ncbi:secreted RxLR effector protein 161-like [Nicotiana sylvestris]|uniref:secreted RxLR effector protein 161-like n=1 Tax=Nicotiana sylvestris TaxID=4096 RepID=UPI00388C53DD
MVVQSLEVNKDLFRPPEEDEELLGPEVPYLGAIGALIHWNGIKHILTYLKGTLNMDLFYANKDTADLVRYADASYLSDPHKARSQTGYVFTCGAYTVACSSNLQATEKQLTQQLALAADKQLTQQLHFFYK